MSDSRRLFLLDGHSLLYKAHHALGSLTNSAGEPTGAIFGFVQILQRLLRDYRPEHLAVVFDPEGPSFRAEIYDQYKANRPPQPPEIARQYERLRELLRLMNVRIYENAPWEADDVIASMAKWAAENGGEAIIVSVDKDLLQCVTDRITVLRDHLSKVEILDVEGVVKKMGVRPEQIPSYLGLLGDASDNIPGVAGVGQKTAQKLLEDFEDIEALIKGAPALADELEKQKGQKRLVTALRKVVENAETARLSTDLATIRHHVAPEYGWDDVKWEGLKGTPELITMLQKLEFRALLEEIGGQTVGERDVDYETVLSREDLEKAAAAIREAGVAAIDTETTDLDPYTASLVGISLSWEKDQAVYVPITEDGCERGLSLEVVREILAPPLRDPQIRWVAHHWCFDYSILERNGFQPGDIEFDTMIASYIVSPDGSTNKLKALGLSKLGIQMTEIEELIGSGDDLVTMAGVAVDKVSEYACQDADVTRQLRDAFEPELEDKGVAPLFREIEMPLTSVLARMQLEGVRLDRDHLKRLSTESVKRLSALTAEIHEIAGRPFNINSRKQLVEILFDELKLPVQKRTATGPSTDVTVLEALSPQHPLPAKLLEYRQLEKLRGTYLDALPKLINPVTGRLHTSFNQTIAATGRLSSSDPNLQNIPVRTEAGREIRRGFIPREEGWKLLGADYSQIELRILAHISGDEALSEAFRTGADIHTLTASKVLGIPQDELTKQQRNGAKAINFGIIYGMSSFRLARDLEISRGEAEQFIRDYFAAYPGVRKYMEDTVRFCAEHGYVETLCGRRRWLPDVAVEYKRLQKRIKEAEEKGKEYDVLTRTLSQPERIAINTPVQGTSADMIKLAMIAIDRRISREGLRSRMILQVHDELIFDCREEELETMAALVKEEMQAALELSVPVEIDVEWGDSWADI